jgi:tetrahydromethanopterin S-methyltransferase subunit E
MPQDVPAGSTITVQVSAPTSGEFTSPADDVQSVINQLSTMGYQSVGAPQINTGSIFNGQLSGEPASYNATLFLVTPYDEDTSEIPSDIQSAYVVALGVTPTSNAVTNISVPPGTVQNSTAVNAALGDTNAPASGTSFSISPTVAPGNSTVPNPGGGPGSLSAMLTSFFNSLESAGTGLVIGLVAILILVLILAAYHPEAAKAAVGAFV